MKLKLYSKLGFIALLALCLTNQAIAQTEIAWGDFSGITNPNGGAGGPFSIDNSAGGGSLTFTTNFIDWDTDNSTVNYFAAGETSNGQISWDGDAATARSLIGFGNSSYSVVLDNISSNDGSLYLGAGAFEDDNTLTVAAFNAAGQAVSLLGSSLIGEWNGLGSGGTPAWDSSLGTLSTDGGGNSGVSTVLDLSDLDIARLELTYASATGGTVRTGDRWHVDIASNAVAAVPEPSSLLLLCSIAGAMAISRRRFP